MAHACPYDQMLIHLEALATALIEKRSDVSDQLFDIIREGEPFHPDAIEQRYIRARLPGGIHVEYDTLTTLISYLLPGSNEWILAGNEEYEDD